MNWHLPKDLPKQDVEVLAEVEGFDHCRYIVVKHDGEGWWQHLPWLGEMMPSDGWFGMENLKILRWAYITD